MITFQPVSYDDISQSRNEYLDTLSAPLDGMWEDAFFANGKHWRIQLDEESIGLCGANEDHALLGFQMFDHRPPEKYFQTSVRELGFRRAFVSTAEPAYLSLCLDYHTTIEINALMFEDDGSEATQGRFPIDTAYRPVSLRELDTAIAFGLDAIGAEREWLEGYYAQRIEQNELFGVWRNDKLLGAGELRVSPSQPGVADVGMVVAPGARNQGIATQILRQLRFEGRQRGLRLVCSTEMENLAAQKAIANAGFYSQHRLLDVSLSLAD